MNITLDQAITIFNHLEETIVFFSPEGNYLSVCGADVCVKESDFAGKNISDVISSETADFFKSKIQESLLKSEVLVFEYKISDILNFGSTGDNGSADEKYYKVRLIPFNGSEPFVVWAAYDISSYKIMEMNFKNNAVEDPVTGVYNRRFFFKELNNFFMRFQRGSNSYSVIMINLDHIEKMSDTYGLEITDQIMSNFINLIKNILRNTDLLASTGDEDFIILLPDTPSKGAELMAERLRTSIEGHIFKLESEQMCVTASFGCSEVSVEDSSYDNVINRAEIALYQAKHNGGNTINRLDSKNWKK